MSVSTQDILAPIHAELEEFERRLEAIVRTDLGEMADVMTHLVRAGGKRLRPAMLLLTAKLGTPDIDEMYNVAIGLEVIHTATLIHDDLIDGALTRRGAATIHTTLGPHSAILAGDYYFARGANLLSPICNGRIAEAVSASVMTICLGELLQITTRADYDQSVDTYLTKIGRKTAALLSACSYCGALVGRLGEDGEQRLTRYGYNVGMAFQIADDVLDYVATSSEIGKPVGADLRQGTVTLPLMYALDDAVVGPRLRAVLARPELVDEDYATVVDLVRRSDGIERAEAHAHRYADLARAELTAFAEGRERSLLEAVCDYVVERRT